MAQLTGPYDAWELDVDCPLVPQPVRVQVSADRGHGYSESVIGWVPLAQVSEIANEITFHGAAGIVEGEFRLHQRSDRVTGTFHLMDPFEASFEVRGDRCEALTTVTLVDEAVDSGSTYHAVIRGRAGLPGYTVYRPDDNERHPVVVWGNGGGSRSNEGALTFLSQIAAAGYAVIAPGDPSNRSGAVMTDASAEVLSNAIEWAVGSDEPYLDAAAIGVMGHSMGGVQAWAGASHPAVKSFACWNGSSGPARHEPTIVRDVRVPALIVTGGRTDGATASSTLDFESLSEEAPAIYIQNARAGHAGLFRGISDPEAVRAGVTPAGEELGVIASVLAVHWLNYTLRGRADSLRYFGGPSSVLAGVPGWEVIDARNLNNSFG